MTKLQKHNPKKKKVCVGEFLFAVNGKLSRMIFEIEGDHQDGVADAQHGVMNYIFLEIANNWCRCPWCKHRSTELLEIINKYKERSHDNPAHEKIEEE